MAQVDFDTKLVIDDRIAVSGKKTIGVQRGGVYVTSQKYSASSRSTSLVSWSINPPSLNTIVSRSVRLNTRVKFTVTAANALAADSFLVSLGNNFAPNQGGFFGRLVSTANLQINNVAVNYNVEDVHLHLLRLFSPEELTKYLGEVPIMPDTFQSYENLPASVNNPISGYGNSTAFSKYPPRGAYAPLIQPGISPSVNPLIRGGQQGETTTFTITYDFSENLCMSPFVYGEASDEAEGMFGINNLQLTLNLSQTLAQRFFAYAKGSDANGIVATTHDINVSIADVEQAELELIYLTMPPTMPLPLRSEVTYFDIPRFVTSFNTLAANSSNPNASSTTITLPTIPEKILVYAKQRTIPNTRADWRLPISAISVNWGNQSQLLANYSEGELYEMSVRNGLNMSYEDWRGEAYVAKVGDFAVNGNAGLVEKTPLVGGYIVIDTAKDLGLPMDQSPNEVAQITLQCNVTINNRSNDNIGAYDLFIVPITSGLFVSEAGQSSVYLSLLSRTMVVDSLEGKAEVMSQSDVKRMVGSGSFWDSFKGVMSKTLPVVKNIAKSINDPRAQAVGSLLESVGYGYSAGGMSAGRRRLM